MVSDWRTKRGRVNDKQICQTVKTFFFRQNQTLSLNNLQVGVYQFKVIVSGGSPPVHGVGFGNVTVSPRKFSLISNLIFQSFQNLFLGGFHMRYCLFLYQHWFFQKLRKGWRLHCRIQKLQNLTFKLTIDGVVVLAVFFSVIFSGFDLLKANCELQCL